MKQILMFAAGIYIMTLVFTAGAGFADGHEGVRHDRCDIVTYGDVIFPSYTVMCRLGKFLNTPIE